MQLQRATRSLFQEEGLVDQGAIALAECLEHYDESRGAKFETHVFLGVRGATINYIRGQDQASHRARNFQKEVDEACAMISDEKMRGTDAQEVTDYLDVPVEEVENHIRYMDHVAALPFESVLQDMIGPVARGELEAENVSTKPEESPSYKELREQLVAAIDSLGEEEQPVISLYYYEELKYSEIAGIFGIGQSRICQIRTKATGRPKANIGEYMKRQGWLMLSGFYTIASGMMMNQKELNVATNDPANIKTSGYRSKRLVKTIFDETSVRQMNGQSTAIGNGPAITPAGVEITSHKQGEIQDTGRTYDLAIDGDGYSIIQGESGTYLTRNDHFSTDEESNLILPDVGMVMNNGGPVYVDENGFNVGKDGIACDDEGNELDQVQTMNPDDMNVLTLSENNTYGVEAGDNLTQVYPSVYQGKLGKSGVDLDTEITRTMEIQRAFQSCARALVISGQMNQKSAFDIGKLQEDTQMNISYYTGVSVMRALQDELGVIADNIANVDTTGYKPRKSSFSDLLYMQMNTKGTDLLVGRGARNTGVESTFVQGSFEQTGHELDFAIDGKAYFTTEMNEEDEKPTYMRDGSFMISIMGDGNYLVTRDGYYALGPEGERIELEYKIVKDENDKGKGAAELDLGNLKERTGLYSYEDPGGLIPVGGNLFRFGEISGEQVSQASMDDGAVTNKILSKTPECPVTMVSTEMINLIEARRALQLSSRIASTADEMENITNTLRQRKI